MPTGARYNERGKKASPEVHVGYSFNSGSVSVTSKRRSRDDRKEQKRDTYLYVRIVLQPIMGILLDLIEIALILVIALLVITIVFRLLPLLILVALVLLVVWFLFYRNRQQ
jgi:uncharacterized membrane protein